jgi:imidazolonepropionase-like amidohydrolase
MSVRALAPLLVAPLAFLAADPPPAFQRDDAAPKAAEPQGRGFLAVRAGTIHLVEDGRVLRDGVVLVKDGVIQAVGTDVAIPADAEVIDYGPDAVVVPGLVAAFSPYALGMPGERSADPGLSALDGFDTFRVYGDALSGGVTSAYIAPAENRLIAGTGAVVKLGGERDAARVLAPVAAIHGAIDASARATGGYWEPPVPVIGNEELGWARPQLPRTAMGAIVALDELLAGSASPDDPALVAEYGPRAPADLARLLAAKVPLRIRAGDAHEIRALLALAARHRTPLVLDGADEAGELAAELAAAGVPVVFRLPFAPNTAAADRGKAEGDRWVELDVPAQLVAAGVQVAITSSAPRDLLFALRVASRGGLDPAAALRAVTLAPARMLGVASRVGSLAVGKDADLCVLNGDPLDPGTSVLATWIGGELAWKAHRPGEATVVEVAELHVGDGEVLRPGQVLMLDGRIAEVGERVSHPRGATVVRGTACMPGMIDAFGHLGLEGSRKVPATDFLLASIVEPGDEVDRRVALEGITTVVLTPRNASDSGAPVMAYKPAARELERQVVGDPVALRFRWEDQSRLRSGQSLRELLAKAAEYRAKWVEYEQALAAWKPAPEPAAEPAKEEDAKDGDEKATAEKSDEPEAEKKDEDAKKDDAKPKKKKKGEPEELEPDPITGVWEPQAADAAGATPLKLRLKLATPGASAEVEGNLRSDAVSRTLVEVAGWFDREKRELTLAGVGSGGWVELTVKLAEEKLAGEVRSGAETHAVALARTSKEYVVARRTERVPEKKEPPKEPKGKPKEPKRDDKLEPLRRALDGKAAVVVEVDRAIDIVPCVEAFAAHGIRPILHGASEAHLVADQIAGKVAGVLLAPGVVLFEPERGTDYRTPYAELQNAGIKVAFQSEAEEGAIDLPLRAAFAVAHGMSPEGALRALTADAADMLELDARVGRLAAGLDADLLLLDGPPLDPATSVLRAWVNGREVEAP